MIHWHRFSDENTQMTAELNEINLDSLTLLELWTNPVDVLAQEADTDLSRWVDGIIEEIDPSLPWALRVHNSTGYEQTIYPPHNEVD